jgi:hypothetical protein
VTAHESKVLDELKASLDALKEEVHVHIALTKQTFETFKQLCDERHGIRPGRLARLEQAEAEVERKVDTKWATLRGLTLPISLIVTLLLVIIDFVVK